MPSSSSPARRGRTIILAAVAIIILLAVGALIGWSVRTVALPQDDGAPEKASTTAVVQQGSVGRSLRLDSTATWPSSDQTGQNTAAGTVTSVEVASGDQVTAGQIVYTVDLAPVVVAQGSVPMFRDIRMGDSGADVVQMQSLLASQGYLAEPFEAEVGPMTREAARAWQSEIGAPVENAADEAEADAPEDSSTPSDSTDQDDGGDSNAEEASDSADLIVPRGRIIFVNSLPARVQVGTEEATDPMTGIPAESPSSFTVGSSVSGGETAFTMLDEAPDFSMTLTDAQAAMIAPGTEVELETSTGETWDALVGDLTPEGDGFKTQLSAEQGSSQPICNDSCAEAIPVEGTSVPAHITIVPETEGLVVPTGAVKTMADGSFAVYLADSSEDGATAAEPSESPQGRETPVDVLASANGQSVITGVDDGSRVMVPAP